MALPIHMPRARWQRWGLVVVALLVLISIIVAFFIQEPLRRRIEAGMNASLSGKGYRVEIRKLDFHPLGFSIDLEDWTVLQEGTRTPLADVPNLSASVQWKALLFARLVADFRIDHPKIHLDQTQEKREVANPTPVKERAASWQHAFEQIYPLKINEIKVVDGEVVYRPDGNFKPLEMRNVNIRAANIRNIRSRDREYPSELHADAVVFNDGRLDIDGNADFLAEPYAGIRTDIRIDKLPLSYVTGALKNFASIRSGTLSGNGMVEYAPKIKQVNLDAVSVTGVDGDYIKTPSNEARGKEVKAKTVEKAKNVSNEPGVELRAKQLRMTDSTLGYIDKTTDPGYRLFVSGLDVTVKNISNQRSEGMGTVTAKGKFLGSGPTSLDVKFHPQTGSPNFDLALRMDDVDLHAMNDLLRAKAKLDVTSGQMGFYSELGVRNNAVDGYVKVLFHDVDIYDSQQDKHKPLLNKVYQMTADVLAKILKNRGTEDVATEASLSGPIENPNASLGEIVSRLIENAFVKAILPGLNGSGEDVAPGTELKPGQDQPSGHEKKHRLRDFVRRHRSHHD